MYDEDDDLARAIAASLLDTQPKPTAPTENPKPQAASTKPTRKSTSKKAPAKEVITIEDSSDEEEIRTGRGSGSGGGRLRGIVGPGYSERPAGIAKGVEAANRGPDVDDEETRFQRDLKAAIEASRSASSSQTQAQPSSHPQGQSQSQSSKRPTVAPASAVEQPPAEAAPSGVSSFLSERARMEKERLERQKRLRPETFSNTASKRATPSSDGEDDLVDLDDSDRDMDVDERPSKKHRVSSSSYSNVRPNASASSSLARNSLKTTGTATATTAGKAASTTVPTIDQVFWDGELRQTATRHSEPRKDGQPTFRLTEVLGPKQDITFAILSSYSLDWAWIYAFFDPSTPVIMVAQPDESGNASVKNVLPHWVRATPFLRNGFGCQHMKFMLLFYKSGRLRVVISTANLIVYDWQDMENTVWLQDIPLLSTPHSLELASASTSGTGKGKNKKAAEKDDFPTHLQRLLVAVNVKPALVALIADGHPTLPLKSIPELSTKWDWSNVKAELVASYAGKHEGWPAVVQTGHPRLMAAVRKLGMRTGKAKSSKGLVIECQGSSLGMYTPQWLNEFHYSARGESAEDWLDRPKKARGDMPVPGVKIVFPSKRRVGETVLGEQGGGTVFCRRKQWSGKNFPRGAFYESKSKGGEVLMHSKMIIGTLQPNAFVSSSSASRSAHARGKQRRKDEVSDSEDEDGVEENDEGIQLVEPGIGWAYVGSHNFTPSAWGTLSGSGFNPVLNISNYEVGVLLLLKDDKEADRIACFERPPRKYTANDEPWMQEESVYHKQ